ncbi:TIGR01777 family oxidoreductase [Pedobacter sp. SYSU D00535]|uniref:TIGR01777 family oxidoreductase n=1 Tax=Pedobacter sp. SYSU D00535 TaxID=2810308 RepID=UPI001A9626D1|nr:TIGR01777 family oxidoreductase [Pedobacter sp. SYSU D00535]
MNKTVLITGGSGLIGAALTKFLLDKGYKVHHLSRKQRATPGVSSFIWDVDKQIIDEECIEGVDVLVHLAGEGIADKPWTNKRKRAIISSRRDSIQLIYTLMQRRPNQIRSVISASGIGIYGNRGNKLLREDASSGNDFLSESCVEWEKAVDMVPHPDLRVVKLRTGVVLSKEGGALAVMERPVQLGLGAPLGSGLQYMPWIHIADMVRMYLFMIENEHLQGTFNACTASVSNRNFTRALAKALKKPMFLPAVPAFILRILLGEMSAVVLSSTNVSAEKINAAGFQPLFPTLDLALADIYERKA